MEEKCANCIHYHHLYVPPLKKNKGVPFGFVCTGSSQVMWLGRPEDNPGEDRCEVFEAKHEQEK